MMGWFIFAAILAFIAIVVFGIGLVARFKISRDDREGRLIASVVAGVGIAIGVVSLLVMFFSSLTFVSANTVGVVTAGGKLVDTVQPGPHMLAPWDSVEEFSTRVQVTDRKAGPEGDTPNADCVRVNLKGGAAACADLTIRYVVNAQDVPDLWRKYGSFDIARDKLLRSATDNAAKQVYGQYAPQDAISGDALSAITKAMTDTLAGQLSESGLTLQTVAPGQLHLAADVQQRLNDVLNAQTATQVAQQNLARNQAEAAANAALTNSLSPQILAQQCIDAAKIIKPAVFNCFGGNAATPLVNVGR